jgi:hypothetical protein
MKSGMAFDIFVKKKSKAHANSLLLTLVAMSWMVPDDVSTTTGADTAGNTARSEPDWPTSPMPSAGGDQEAGSVSSPSAASFSSSSSSADHLSFITSTQRNSSASPLCFGARKLLRRSRAHVPETKQQEEEAPPKGNVVGRYLRKISRRLRKARAAAVKEPPPCAPVDDTARERAEAVASAVAYCNESLRRGASTARLVSSPSLDCWLRGWREEGAAAHCDGEYGESHCPPP